MTSTSPSILVVDDDVDTCHNLRDILTDLGYDVETAHNGFDALEMVRRKRFDIALLDLKMPGMDGLTLYRHIREVRSDTVAIVITAYASLDTRQHLLTAGAWQVLPKPVDLSSLLPLVETAAEQPLILIVDDDPDLCQGLWDVLRDRGYRVCVAHSEDEAARHLQTSSFGVVLIDLRLPGGDGSSVFRLVRQTNPHARTVVITGHRSELDQLVDRLVSEGADAVCYKPFNFDMLLGTLKQLTRQEPIG